MIGNQPNPVGQRPDGPSAAPSSENAPKPSYPQMQFSDAAGYRYHLVPVLLCVAAGLALSTLPFALWWSHLDTWIYIADDDNLYYLQLAALAYYNHAWHISDPAYADAFPSAFPAETGWTLIQSGPSWRIWEKEGHADAA